MIFKISIALK